MTDHLITGIQQIGIGTDRLPEAMLYYSRHHGMSTLLFDDEAQAALMTRYTGGEVHSRRAALTLNQRGGGGYEIWQFTSRDPEQRKNPARYGDIGICAAIHKTPRLDQAVEQLRHSGISCSAVQREGGNWRVAYFSDPWGNRFKLIETTCRPGKPAQLLGGVCGAVIGVRSLERSEAFYRDVLGFQKVLWRDVDTQSNEETGVPKGNRVVLHRPQAKRGAFSSLLGETFLELVERADGQGEPLYHRRYWGDPGFIHLCFDVVNLGQLKQHAEKLGHKFTVDSESSFDMENAGGRFAYIEDPDGTLIELVEVHHIPIVKKPFMALRFRRGMEQKPLPGWMLRLMHLNKVPQKSRH